MYLNHAIWWTAIAIDSISVVTLSLTHVETVSAYILTPIANKLVFLLAHAFVIDRKCLKIESDAIKYGDNGSIILNIGCNGSRLKKANIIDDSSRALALVIFESRKGGTAAEAELSDRVDRCATRDVSAASWNFLVWSLAGGAFESSWGCGAGYAVRDWGQAENAGRTAEWVVLDVVLGRTEGTGGLGWALEAVRID